MKVAQNDETNPDTQPVRPPHIPSIANSQLSPSGSSVRKCRTPGILSRMFSPLHRYHLLLRQVTSSTAYCRFTLCDALIALLFIVFPLRYFFPIDPETTGDPQFDYGVDDHSLPEQPGKPPPDHQISPILLYTACIREVQHVTVRLLLFCCIACHCCYSH